MRNDHSSEPSKVRGASSTGILLAVLGSGLLVVAVFAWLSPARPPLAGDARATAPLARAPEHDAPLAEIDREGPRLPTPMDPPPPALGPNRFDGRGRIHGEVLAAKSVTYPNDWTLVIEPSPTLIGSEHAATRRIEFHAGERAFDVPDLPLAGYRVRAEAPALNCTDLSALLIKGSEVAFATLEFRPSGFIDGRVLAANGAPADGVDVVLESVETKLRREQRADAAGGYVFRDVLDGVYRLYVGRPETPLVPPGDIRFTAPSLRFKDVTLPPTGAIVLHTRAENGAPVADVEVSGFGSMGGALRARSDYLGIARLPWLPPGEYRIEGRTDDGRRGRVNVVVQADVDVDGVLHVR